MTCRSYFSLFDVAVLFPLFYCYRKKNSLSLMQRASSFSLFFLYSHHILCRERLLLRSIHNSSETQKERNGMRWQIKKAKKKKVEYKTSFQLVCYDCVTCFLIIIDCGSHFSSSPLSSRINRKKNLKKDR